MKNNKSNKKNDDDDTLAYPGSLWPLIRYRTLHKMDFPTHVINHRTGGANDDDDADDDYAYPSRSEQRHTPFFSQRRRQRRRRTVSVMMATYTFCFFVSCNHDEQQKQN